MKVDLDFNLESLRITDPGEEAQGTPGFLKPQTTSIMASIKAKSSVDGERIEYRAADEYGGSVANQGWKKPEGGTHVWDKPLVRTDGEAQNSKLKAMLAGLKK